MGRRSPLNFLAEHERDSVDVGCRIVASNSGPARRVCCGSRTHTVDESRATPRRRPRAGRRPTRTSSKQGITTIPPTMIAEPAKARPRGPRARLLRPIRSLASLCGLPAGRLSRYRPPDRRRGVATRCRRVSRPGVARRRYLNGGAVRASRTRRRRRLSRNPVRWSRVFARRGWSPRRSSD